MSCHGRDDDKSALLAPFVVVVLPPFRCRRFLLRLKVVNPAVKSVRLIALCNPIGVGQLLIAPFRHCWLYCYALRNGMTKTRPVRAMIATQSRLTRGTFSYSLVKFKKDNHLNS